MTVRPRAVLVRSSQQTRSSIVADLPVPGPATTRTLSPSSCAGGALGGSSPLNLFAAQRHGFDGSGASGRTAATGADRGAALAAVPSAFPFRPPAPQRLARLDELPHSMTLLTRRSAMRGRAISPSLGETRFFTKSRARFARRRRCGRSLRSRPRGAPRERTRASEISSGVRTQLQGRGNVNYEHRGRRGREARHRHLTSDAEALPAVANDSYRRGSVLACQDHRSALRRTPHRDRRVTPSP